MEHKIEQVVPYASRSHEEMKDVLMDPRAEGPSIHYYMIRGGSDKRNITVWETGTVGSEFIKAYGHYHIKDFDETYDIIAGKGILITQDRELDDSGLPINNRLKNVKAIFVQSGDKITIPPRFGHMMVNIGDTWLVTSDDSPVAMTSEEKASWPAHADYSAVKEMHGFGYYVIKKDEDIEFIKNDNYKSLPEIEIIKN